MARGTPNGGVRERVTSPLSAAVQGADEEEKLRDRLEILRKRRAGAGSIIGGIKERTERLKLVDKDIASVEKKLVELRSLQGRVRERRKAEKEVGIKRGGQ